MKRTIPVSVSLPRELFVAIEQLAAEAAGGVFSRAAAQLAEIGLAALQGGFRPPPGWIPVSGAGVLHHYGVSMQAARALALPPAMLPRAAPRPPSRPLPAPAPEPSRGIEPPEAVVEEDEGPVIVPPVPSATTLPAYVDARDLL